MACAESCAAACTGDEALGDDLNEDDGLSIECEGTRGLHATIASSGRIMMASETDMLVKKRLGVVEKKEALGN